MLHLFETVLVLEDGHNDHLELLAAEAVEHAWGFPQERLCAMLTALVDRVNDDGCEDGSHEPAERNEVILDIGLNKHVHCLPLG